MASRPPLSSLDTRVRMCFDDVSGKSVWPWHRPAISPHRAGGQQDGDVRPRRGHSFQGMPLVREGGKCYPCRPNEASPFSREGHQLRLLAGQDLIESARPRFECDPFLSIV
jgi:hypothetical protein